MEELYKRYGQLMIQAEIINGQIQECKRQIAEGLNKQNAPKEPEVKPDAN